MKIAVIYARYSSDSQSEQSIEGQLHACEEYARTHDILILDTYIDRAMTGTNDNRTDFQRMLKDSSKREWTYVLVYKLDRFSRNKYATAIHKKTLRDNGVKLLSATEHIPDAPEGILFESMLEGYAEYYSAELSQKVKRGMRENRRKGHYQGGGLPYGYKVVDKKILIDEEKAETVRFIFQQYAAGVYVRDIIKELTAMGVSYKGKPFAKNTIYGILKNEKYSGVYYHEEERIEHMYPQLVPTHLYEAVRAKVEKNKFGKRSVRTVYLFRNKMTCGYCGKPISAETGTARNGEIRRYYKCLGKKAYHTNCEQGIYGKEALEEAVTSEIKKALSSPKTVDYIVKNLLKLQDEYCAENPRLRTIEREMAKVKKALENMVSAIEQGVISKTTNQRLHELEKQQEDLERELLIEKSKTSVKVPESIIREYYNEAISLTMEMIVNTLVKEIVVYNDRIEIYFNSPIKNGPDGSQGLSFYRNIMGTSDIRSMELEMYVG